MKSYVSILAMPDIANHMGIVHGGELVKIMDNTAGVAAARFCGGNVVTAHMETDFKEKVILGDYIRSEAEVVFTGRTSLVSYVALYAENLKTGVVKKAAEGYYIMVAIDEKGKPRPIEKLCEIHSPESAKAKKIYNRQLQLSHGENTEN